MCCLSLRFSVQHWHIRVFNCSPAWCSEIHPCKLAAEWISVFKVLWLWSDFEFLTFCLTVRVSSLLFPVLFWKSCLPSSHFLSFLPSTVIAGLVPPGPFQHAPPFVCVSVGLCLFSGCWIFLLTFSEQFRILTTTSQTFVSYILFNKSLYRACSACSTWAQNFSRVSGTDLDRIKICELPEQSSTDRMKVSVVHVETLWSGLI